MVAMPRPTKHPKTGVYYFRRAVPDDLRDQLGWEIKVSLRTKDVREAKRRHAEELNKFDQRIELARSGYSLTPKTAKALAGKWLRKSLEEDYQRRDHEIPEEEQFQVDDEHEPYDFHIYGLGDAYESGRHAEMLSEDVDDVLQTEGITIHKHDKSYELLIDALFWAKLQLLRTLNQRAGGDWSTTSELDSYPEYIPPSSNRKSSHRAAIGASDEVLISKLFESWKLERVPPAKTEAEFSKGIRRFIELHGDLPAISITKPMVRSYKEALRRLPAILGSDLRDKSVPEILKAVEQVSPVRTLSPASINKHIASLSAILTWAEDNGYFDEDPNWSNPTIGVKVAEKANVQERRLAYSDEDLLTILGFPIFSLGERPKGGAGEASVWLPLMALYSGARVEELGQLLVKDIHREGDVWYVDINTLDQGKKLKTAGSRRKIPLHPELVRSGFLAYWNQRRASDSSRLFPDLRPDHHGSLTGNWSKWWGRYARQNGISDPRKVFHSFRHTFKTACRKAGIRKEIHDALTGHRTGDVGDDYGDNYPVSVLAPELSKVRYEGLKLPILCVPVS